MPTKGPIIIKIGTRVLTTEEGVLDIEVLETIVEQIATLYNRGFPIILVSSGAAACGREILCFRDEKDPIIEKQMLTAIGQARLMKNYGRLFKKYGIPVAQALLERTNFSNRKRYLNLKHTLEGLMKHQVIPIVNENDVIATRELRFGDNDELASLLSIGLHAQKLIICSDVNGLYSDDPNTNPDAKIIPEVSSVSTEIQKMAKQSTSGVGLGGMLSKLKVAKQAMHWGVEMWITYGKRPNGILDIIGGKGVGTCFKAEANPAKDFQRWLSSAALSSGGNMRIDQGALSAIRDRKSLLLVGVKEASGEFKAGDIIDIYEGEDRVAIGISNYHADDLREYIFEHEDEKRFQKAVVHADNIVILPGM